MKLYITLIMLLTVNFYASAMEEGSDTLSSPQTTSSSSSRKRTSLDDPLLMFEEIIHNPDKVTHHEIKYAIDYIHKNYDSAHKYIMWESNKVKILTAAQVNKQIAIQQLKQQVKKAKNCDNERERAYHALAIAMELELFSQQISHGHDFSLT